MTWLFVIGAAMTVLGLAIMSGLMEVLMSVTGYLLMGGGVVVAVLGGAALMFGSAKSKAMGAGGLILGIAIAVMGVVVTFAIRLWFITWLMEFGGGVMLVLGIIMAIIGLLGMLKRSGSNGEIRYGKGRSIRY